MFKVHSGIQFKNRSAAFKEILTSNRRVGFKGINGKIKRSKQLHIKSSHLRSNNVRNNERTTLQS